LGTAAREALRLSLSAASNPAPSVGAAVSIAVNNALHAGWPLALDPLGAARRRGTRALGDVAVTGNLVVCAVLVGVALADRIDRADRQAETEQVGCEL
jgi:predicted NAD/FAD-dependent oxidoreductase